MKVVTPEEMREIDSRSMGEYRISGEILMERAGMAVSQAVMKIFHEGGLDPRQKTVVAVSGSGHNGADSLVALRDLVSRGFKGSVVLMESDPGRQSEAVRREVDRLRSMNVLLCGYSDKAARHRITHAGLIVDGLLGTGFKGEPSEMVGQMIEEINRSGGSGVPIVSVDIPSGVDGLTGQVPTTAVAATVTVTMGAPKWGLLVDPGTRHAGSLWISSIGFPPALLEGGKRSCLTPSEAIARLSKRFPSMHKGQAGHVLIYGGSPGKTGAVLLSARGALRMGSGLVTILWDERFQGYATELQEVMGTYYSSTDPTAALATLSSAISGKAAVACGPGLSIDDLNRTILEHLLREYEGPLVADAGVFSFFSGRPEDLAKLRTFPLILTPHPGELARLMGVRTEMILEDPTRWAQEAALRTSSVVLLKGSRTIVADHSASLYVNMTGTALMAGAGMGDVLTGMIVSLLGQGHNPFEATCLGAYFHGAVGNMLSDSGPSRGCLSSELADGIPELLARWERTPSSAPGSFEDPYYLWPTGKR